ncbi:hypothetical protein SAMN05421736_10789 [Evansella caseinilytica]|uniref:DUF2225 domain-containing protein n=1 Tax=Evansella caseinilytica TaxID=1503961 RepID=A0A1H3QX25_9BACI|nr:DUF2225 domain-containing protein [Evansella caseinilytica]SDZ17916.1 hypothetical protein SAMN05421736_10789 [Evansella caseinilytica]
MDIPALYDKTFHCPICNSSFTSKKLRSRAVRVERIDNDFYTLYKNPEYNPTLYEVSVCEHCGFASTEHFTFTFDQKVKERFQEHVTPRWGQQVYSGERTHEDAAAIFKLALISATETNQPAVVIAGLCLRLSWLYRYMEMREEEERFLAHALKYYDQSYINGDFKEKNMSELMLLFLLGELHRKSSHHEVAGKYFSKVIQHKNRHTEPSIVEKAREQWYITRELSKS